MKEAGVLGSRLFVFISANYLNLAVRVRSGNAIMNVMSNFTFPVCWIQIFPSPTVKSNLS
jgi:hypothetical protein